MRVMIKTISGMREIVLAQTRNIDQCLHLLSQQRDSQIALEGDPAVFQVILPMTHMVGISGHSILKLTDEIGLGAKDAYPIARAIVEGSINVCFIMAQGKEMAERAMRHAEVRSYRDRDRKWVAGGMNVAASYSGELEPEVVARLEGLLPEFTSARWREKDWTDKSLKERLDATAEVFPNNALISLVTSAFNIYRHSSEVIHGSYFSALYFWGISTPGRGVPTTADELRSTMLDHQFSILMSTIFAFSGLVECFAAYTNQQSLREASNALLEKLSSLPVMAGGMRTGENNI